MAYVPQFDFDLFVSYRHASNEGEDPWVDAFCQQLRQQLVELAGDIIIWRDSAALRAGDHWRPEIGQALERAAIFLAIISRTYFDSDICRSELDHFMGQRRKDLATGKIRLVPIFKQPPKPDQDLPRELAEIHRHEFYEYYESTNPGQRRFREFGPGNSATATQFIETLSQLAQDLGFVLDELRSDARRQTVGTVFLATVGPELAGDRARLRADLQQRHYEVLPATEYFWNADEFEERLAEDLGAAQLCIHLVSRGASIEPETPEHARIQLDRAIKAMKDRGRPLPLVWIPPAQATTPEAGPLIDYIERDAANQGVEYWPGAFEDFKTQIYDRLEHSTPKPEPVKAAATGDVALIFADDDQQAVDPLLRFLADTIGVGIRRVKSPSSGPVAREAIAAALERSDRAVVVWGSQKEDWIADLLSVDALSRFGRGRCCVFGATPASPEKETYRTGKATVVAGSAPGWEQELRVFFTGRSQP